MKKLFVMISAIMIISAISVFCQDKKETTATAISSKQPAGTIDASLANEAFTSLNRGFDWLAKQQNEEGYWSDKNFPALTALSVWPFINSKHPEKDKIIEKAIKYIKSCVRDDGSICREIPGRKGGGLSNYNTAICMTVLYAAKKNDPEIIKIVQNARKFLAGTQHFGDDEYSGGFGYDKDNNRAYTDLMNTYYTMEAMAKTKDVEDLKDKDAKKVDIDWKETVKYIEKLQAKPESGEDNAGGLTYNPTDPKAGTLTNKSGVVYFRSYGSITYAGMLALVYANVSKEDVRVKSAQDWAMRHWTLEENPGMGTDSLYFFYNILTKCMNAMEQEDIHTKDNKSINWRKELTEKLVKLQKVDEKTGSAYWENTSNKHMENDKVLVTAYSLYALQLAIGDGSRVK